MRALCGPALAVDFVYFLKEKNMGHYTHIVAENDRTLGEGENVELSKLLV